ITETMTGGTPSGIIGTVATYRTAHTGIAYVAIGGGSSASGTSMADDVVSTASAGAGLFVRFFGIASNAGSFTTSGVIDGSLSQASSGSSTGRVVSFASLDVDTSKEVAFGLSWSPTGAWRYYLYNVSWTDRGFTADAVIKATEPITGAVGTSTW